MAGAALAAAFAATAQAADRPPIEPVRIEHAAIAEHGPADDPASPPAKGWTIYVGAAAALAAVLKLIGARRLVAAGAAIGPVVRQTAEAVASGAAKAGEAIGRAVASPFRAAFLATGLGLFALTGIWLFDVEWLAGLLFGALSAGIVLFGLGKVRRSRGPAVWRGRR